MYICFVFDHLLHSFNNSLVLFSHFRKIIVHDTNPALFQMFLEYLYSGELETSELATEQLADIMQISDRYEVIIHTLLEVKKLTALSIDHRLHIMCVPYFQMDSLKLLCEHSLRHHLDEDTALFLLSLADQFHAKILRVGHPLYDLAREWPLEGALCQRVAECIQVLSSLLLSYCLPLYYANLHIPAVLTVLIIVHVWEKVVRMYASTNVINL